MKKLIFALFALFLAVAPVSGQVYSMLATTGNAADTVNNTSAETLTKQINGSYGEVTVQLTVTKISGTVAGTAVLQGSLDGTNYTILGYVNAQPADTANSVTNTNITTNVWTWPAGSSKYLYYRVTVTGSGTMSARVSAKIMVRKSG